jgi:hypothetical protein
MAEPPKKVRFTYVSPDAYEPKFANGAHGSATPRGEIIIHFFHERPPLPKADTHAILPTGMLAAQPEQTPLEVLNLERHVITGVILSGDTARSLYVWLGQKLEELKVQLEMQKANLPGPSH